MAYAYQPQQAGYFPQPYPMRTTAPVSLHIVAIFQYLGGLLVLAAGAFLALAAFRIAPELHYTTGASTFTTRPQDVTLVTGVICGTIMCVGLITIILGRKVQVGRNWARVLLTLLNGLSVAGGVWQGYSAGAPYAQTLISVAFPLLFVLLLNTRAARSWCRYGTY
jgi:hypothetical protein